MKRSFSRGTLMLSAGLLVAVACAGRSLQDVGDIQGEGGEANAGGNTTEPGGSGGEDVGVSGSNTTLGGGGSTYGDPDPIGGFGGGSGSEGFVCEACDLVAETPDIRDLWVQGEQLYWIEYGGFDDLENYLENGRLMTMPVAGGEVVVVADGLQGPIQLAVSENHAYVLIDRSSTTGGANKLLRVPLDTGEEQELQAFPDGFESYYNHQNDWARRYFALAGGYAFWRRGDSVYRLAEDAETAPEAVFAAGDVVGLLADESMLYVKREDALTTMSFSGVAGTTLWEGATGSLPLAPASGYLYSVDAGATTYLTRLPIGGGAFKRVGKLAAHWPTRLQTDGERFVVDLGARLDPEANASSALWDGRVADPASARLLASAPAWDDGRAATNHGLLQIQWRAWDVSPTKVFIGYGDQLYAVTREP